jgi:hypothetical protein
MAYAQHVRAASGLMFASAIAIACGSFGGSDNSTSDATDGGAPDGANDEASSVSGGPGATDGGDAGKPPPPTVCDLSYDPIDNPLCVTDQFGVFVDGTSGDDTANDGSMKKPWKTVVHALASSSNKPRVYICAGTYSSQALVIDATTGSITASVYGGFACSTWTVDPQNNVVTITDGALPALRVKGASKLTIADISFTSAAGATSDAPNSITGVIVNSTGIALKRVSFSAGAGFTQTKPAAPATNIITCPANGMAALFNGVSTTGGIAEQCNCVDGTYSIGGGGGATASDGNPGQIGTAGVAGLYGQACQNGGTFLAGTGGDGANGTGGGGGTASTHAGTVDVAAYWLPSNGTKGNDGRPGQGGGGGSAGMTNVNTAGGGGGGVGGCGGAGSAGGLGGGASIALYVTGSTVAITSSTFKTAGGGAGADGATPEQGAAGGGRGASAGTGCSGGKGGTGAGGTGGGGGAGGSSIGLLFSGSAPTLDGTTVVTTKTQAGFTVGVVGTNGKGGSNTGCPSGQDGALGVASAVLDAAGL